MRRIIASGCHIYKLENFILDENMNPAAVSIYEKTPKWYLLYLKSLLKFTLLLPYIPIGIANVYRLIETNEYFVNYMFLIFILFYY